MSIVAEQLLRLLHHCGAPKTDVDMVHGDGRVVNGILRAVRCCIGCFHLDCPKYPCQRA